MQFDRIIIAEDDQNPTQKQELNDFLLEAIPVAGAYNIIYNGETLSPTHPDCQLFLYGSHQLPQRAYQVPGTNYIIPLHLLHAALVAYNLEKNSTPIKEQRPPLAVLQETLDNWMKVPTVESNKRSYDAARRKAEIKRLYNAGVSCTVIADQLGVAPSTVYDVIKRIRQKMEYGLVSEKEHFKAKQRAMATLMDAAAVNAKGDINPSLYLPTYSDDEQSTKPKRGRPTKEMKTSRGLTSLKQGAYIAAQVEQEAEKNTVTRSPQPYTPQPKPRVNLAAFLTSNEPTENLIIPTTTRTPVTIPPEHNLERLVDRESVAKMIEESNARAEELRKEALYRENNITDDEKQVIELGHMTFNEVMRMRETARNDLLKYMTPQEYKYLDENNVRFETMLPELQERAYNTDPEYQTYEQRMADEAKTAALMKAGEGGDGWED